MNWIVFDNFVEVKNIYVSFFFEPRYYYFWFDNLSNGSWRETNGNDTFNCWNWIYLIDLLWYLYFPTSLPFLSKVESFKFWVRSYLCLNARVNCRKGEGFVRKQRIAGHKRLVLIFQFKDLCYLYFLEAIDLVSLWPSRLPLFYHAPPQPACHPTLGQENLRLFSVLICQILYW